MAIDFAQRKAAASHARSLLSASYTADVATFADNFCAALALEAPDLAADQIRWLLARHTTAVRELGIDDSTDYAVVVDSLVEFAGREASEATLVRLEALSRGLSSFSEARSRALEDLTPGQRRYLDDALAERDDKIAHDIARGELTFRSFLDDLIAPVHRAIGEAYESGELHFRQISTVVDTGRRVMSGWELADQGISTGPDRRLIMGASLTQVGHGVGLEMVLHLLASRGWTSMLVESMNAESLVRQIRRHRPDVVALSAATVGEVDLLRRYISAIRSEPHTADTPVIVGGRPFNTTPHLVDAVGADGWAKDARSAYAACQGVLAVSREGLDEHQVDLFSVEGLLGLSSAENLAAVFADGDDTLSVRGHQRESAVSAHRSAGSLGSHRDALGEGPYESLSLVPPDGRLAHTHIRSDIVDLAHLLTERAAIAGLAVNRIERPTARVAVQADAAVLGMVIDRLLFARSRLDPAGEVKARLTYTEPALTFAIDLSISDDDDGATRHRMGLSPGEWSWCVSLAKSVGATLADRGNGALLAFDEAVVVGSRGIIVKSTSAGRESAGPARQLQQGDREQGK